METLFILIFVPLLVSLLLVLSPLISITPLGKYRADYDKISAYECGFTTIPGQNRAPMTIAFYIVSILYLVFDLEIALLIPLVVTNMSISSYIPVIFFIFVLTIGFCFEISSGALNWSKKN